MHEGFLVASADTLPFGWAPKRKFASADLAEAWSKLQRCCGDFDEGWPQEPDDAGPCLSKKLILATIGLWTKQERLAWTVRRTSHNDDMPGPVRMTSFRPDGSVLKYCATTLHHDRTMLPVALLSLFDEARRMHRARQLVAQVPAIVPLGCFVDGLFYSGPPEADRALRALAEAQKRNLTRRSTPGCICP